ncbi:MAG TPA: hypothetical protein PKC18_20505, partial [Lacipirellulaceae bacterium]|nr:hypothetical protein [Lacipirellulaceae bacterium]
SMATPGSTLMGNGFQPTDLPSFAEFGTVLDLDGDMAIIGLDRLGLGGAAYVYDTEGNLIRKFTPPINPNTGNPVRGFGRSVAISGNVALIGATPDDAQVNEATEFGRAYLYDIPSGDLLFELVPNDSMPGDLFGDVVSLSGNLALVNARREDVLGIINEAYVFDVSTGRQLLKLDNSDFVAGDEVFEAVAIHGGRVVAGVEGYDSPGFNNNGIAVAFDVLFADYNRDGIVDAADYTVWRNSLGDNVVRFEGADGNGDMIVDHDDYLLWKAMYGTAAPVPVTALGVGGLAGQSLPVPEPASALLLMAALAFTTPGSRIARRDATI